MNQLFWSNTKSLQKKQWVHEKKETNEQKGYENGIDFLNAAAAADGVTAFHMACAGGHPDCAEALLHAGADFRKRDVYGATGARVCGLGRGALRARWL